MRHDQEWPLVHPQDDGIRPAGSPTACFYCKQEVGQPHLYSCVAVQKKVTCGVSVKGISQDQLRLIWNTECPAFWDAESFEYHKNESSWCQSNFIDHLRKIFKEQGSSPESQKWIRKIFKKLKTITGSDCLCGWLTFKVIEMSQEPFITIRKQK
jgi:hypothetical protein